jgi:DNA repair ATPase RecN
MPSRWRNKETAMAIKIITEDQAKRLISVKGNLSDVQSQLQDLISDIRQDYHEAEASALEEKVDNETTLDEAYDWVVETLEGADTSIENAWDEMNDVLSKCNVEEAF